MGPPVDLGMPICQLAGKPPRCLRDNLQSANHGVNRLSVVAESGEIELGGESLDRVNVVDDVTETLSRVLRRHGSRRAECYRGAEASESYGSPRRRRHREIGRASCRERV